MGRVDEGRGCRRTVGCWVKLGLWLSNRVKRQRFGAMSGLSGEALSCGCRTEANLNSSRLQTSSRVECRVTTVEQKQGSSGCRLRADCRVELRIRLSIDRFCVIWLRRLVGVAGGEVTVDGVSVAGYRG